MLYSIRHVCKLYQVSSETVRNWSEEFARHLSVTSNPGKGRQRKFTLSDMEVFALVAEMKQQGAAYIDIHVSLDAGQRGDAPELPVSELQAIVAGENEKQLAGQLEQLRLAMLHMQQERDRAVAQAKEYEHDNIKLKTQLDGTREMLGQRIDELTLQLEKAQKHIEDLSKEVGAAYVKGVMETLERRGDLPRKDT